MMQSLESLDLSGTSLEDEDLVHLKGLNRLTALYLNCQLARSDISNLGLAELAQIASLRRLELTTNCSISALGDCDALLTPCAVSNGSYCLCLQSSAQQTPPSKLI